MNDTKVTCPKCNGQPEVPSIACGPDGARMMTAICQFCSGTGRVLSIRALAYAHRREARAARIAAHESSADAAADLGMSPRAYNDWENGKDI